MKIILFFLVFLFSVPLVTATEIDTLCATDSSSIPFVGELINTTYTLKVLLVEFSDVKHRNPNDDGKPEYTMNQWNNHFFSQWTYISPNKYSPDNQSVYGSMKDYYYLMSDGEFTLNGYILNPDNNEDGVPDWIALPNSKTSYDNGGNYTFRQTAKTLAQAAGLNVSTSSSVKLVIVYAGHTYRTMGGLHPRASGSEYVTGERFAYGNPNNQERPDAKFAGIGIHCHEFGHLLGWPDTYWGKWDNGWWDCMAGGNYNNWMHAPAPVNPQLRIEKGWITPQIINSDITFSADYDLKDPEIFKIVDNANPDRYFLIENRHFEATMNFSGIVAYDYNHFLPWNRKHTKPDLPNQGILVWGHRKYYSSQRDPNNSYDPIWCYLIQADGFNNANTQHNTYYMGGPYDTGDSGDPFPGYWGVNVFSPWSFPSSIDIGPSPSSLLSNNVGFEITEMGYDYITIDLYYESPEDASPAMPRFLEVSEQNNHPYLMWNANTEPDFSHYEVWKKLEGETWSLKTTTTNNYYTDNSEQVFTGPSGAAAETIAYYKIKAVDNSSNKSDFSNIVEISVFVRTALFKPVVPKDEDIIPKEYNVSQNFPNPFNPETSIRFEIPEDNFVNLVVYNIQGEKVETLVNEPLTAGSYTAKFDASQMPSGVYIYKIQAGSYSQIKRMLLIK